MRILPIAVTALALAGCAQPAGYREADAAACQGAGAPGSQAANDCREQREGARADAARSMANSTPITGYGPMRGGRF